MLPRPRNEKNIFSPVVREGITFLARMMGGALLLFILLAPLENSLQALEVTHARIILSTLGLETRAGETPTQFRIHEKTIEISPLCSGLVELVLLASAVFATRHVSMRARTTGIIITGLALYATNLLRIVGSVMQIQYTPLAFATLTHDTLFRGALLLGFALIYAGWVRWTTRPTAMTAYMRTP